MNIVDTARAFAYGAHGAIDHNRKYTGEPYMVHLAEVAHLVSRHDGSNNMCAAAWLHDVVEDTHVSIEMVYDYFGHNVAALVEWLTDTSRPEDGNRAARKAIDRERLAQAPIDAQTIKLCDLISNTRSIVQDDPSFAKVYLNEKAELLKVMDKGNSYLYEWALNNTGMRGVA